MSATVALGIAGAAIGGAVGGPAGARIGWAVGTLVGGVLFAPRTKDQERGKIDDLRFTGSGYGAPIPQVYGSFRVGGNAIDVGDLIETATARRVGGKGGGRPTVKEYAYTVDIAVMWARGPVGEVRKIWAEDRLLWDKTASPAVLPENIINYLGTETQEPSSVLEALHGGVGTVPAYRGLCYTVFNNLDLSPYGNRIPAMTAEIGPLPELKDQAILHGAEAVYTFNEASGDLLNQEGDATYDLANAAGVTRQVAGVNLRDKLAYTYASAAGSSPLFNHTQGVRATANGSQAFTAECICKRGAIPGSQKHLIYGQRSGTNTVFGMTVASVGSLHASIQITGQAFVSQEIASAAEAAQFAHYVWTWDGSDFKGYRNGVQKFSVNLIGGGGVQDATPFDLAIGGVTGTGSLNSDCTVDFLAYYPTTLLTLDQIADHVTVAGT